jgi:hypothetical protein
VRLPLPKGKIERANAAWGATSFVRRHPIQFDHFCLVSSLKEFREESLHTKKVLTNRGSLLTRSQTAWTSKYTTSQVELLITNYSIFIVHCAKSNSTVKNKSSSWLWCCWSTSGFSSRLVCSFCLLVWVFHVSFCTHEGTSPYQSCAHMSFRGEVCVSFVVLGV